MNLQHSKANSKWCGLTQMCLLSLNLHTPVKLMHSHKKESQLYLVLCWDLGKPTHKAPSDFALKGLTVKAGQVNG